MEIRGCLLKQRDLLHTNFLRHGHNHSLKRKWMGTYVGAGCGVWGGRFLCRSRACGWRGPAFSCSSPSLSPPSPPGWCRSEEGTSLSVKKRCKWITQWEEHSRQEDGNMLSFAVSDSRSSLTMLSQWLSPVTSPMNAASASPWRWRAAPTGSLEASPRWCSAQWCSICPEQCHDKLWGPNIDFKKG